MEIGNRGSIGFTRIRTTSFLAPLLLLGVAINSPSQSLPASESTQKIQELIQQGNTAAAQKLLSEALKASPRDANLYNLDGVIKAQNHDFAGAEASFRRAIELSPTSEETYFNLGHLYQEWIPQQAAARDKAIDVYAQVLKLDPGNTEAELSKRGPSDAEGTLRAITAPSVGSPCQCTEPFASPLGALW